MSKDTIEKFNFFLPADCIKAEEDADGKRWIQGIASTEHTDLQGEKVAQKGIEYDYFLRHGFINNDHLSGVENKVGEPVEAKITDKGFWIKGFLYKGKEKADYWWEHLQSLKHSGGKRKVGFSIQGKVKKKNGNKITKCWIQDVAITASPVNTKTWAEIAKSLSESEWEAPCCADAPNCECSKKALSAGGMGGALVPESLEGSAKITTYKSLDSVPDDVNLSFTECVQILQLSKGWSRPTAEAVVDAIWLEKGLK